MDAIFFQTKLAARLHDPAEKALVLLRDPAGHENGTSRALARLLGYHELPETIDADNDEALVKTVLAKTGFGAQIPRDMYRHLQRADWWAAAADRPQWPLEEITVTTRDGEQKRLAVAPWSQVRWSEKPQLVHPLTGEVADLGWLGNVAIESAKQRAFDHFGELLVKLGAGGDAQPDWRKLLLAFWRFGPEFDVTGSDAKDNDRLGPLWALLPADTRVPDHSIWGHLDLTSAFAGAFAADPQGEAALLALSLGPVQGFIAQARKLDDLWAGSHLLSRLAWETMKPLAEELGPDAILFPRLRGLAQVDLWLRDEMGLPKSLFENCEWMRGSSDANPLFAAALPNRFVAVVPAGRARELAESCAQAARKWVGSLGERTVARLLREAGVGEDPNAHAYAQMRAQLQGFPEVHWAAVPFSLIRCRDEEKQRDLDPSGLLSAMAPFYGAAEGQGCGFLESPAWEMLAQELEIPQGQRRVKFLAPNPGVLYPAVYELAERVLAAAKAARPFEQLEQRGWRDSLSGEVEWLTQDPDHLQLPPGRRANTLWTTISTKRRAWAKKGEHLGALAAIKRLWPTLFGEEVGEALGHDLGRYSVSTHAMALAAQLDAWLARGALTEGLEEAERSLGKKPDRVSLPRKLVLLHAKAQPQALADARRIPALLDAAAELDEKDDPAGEKANRIREAVRRTLAQAVDEGQRRDFRLETYYGLLMMDGDRMGKILSGDDATAITYLESFHEQVRADFQKLAKSNPGLQTYGNLKRAMSPGRHVAISSALNDFSQYVARHVVEEEFRGRLIYSGGDDVLATLPVADLLDCALRLRHAYRGTLPEDETKDWGDLGKDRRDLHCKSGFAWLRGRLMRMMGRNATASAGVVVAHNQAPLGAVLRELRATEKTAKEQGGRDALAIRVIKRAGGVVGVVVKWDDLKLLQDVIDFLRASGTSRRAVYHSLSWLDDVPDPRANAALCSALLAYQFDRQSKARDSAGALAQRVLQWSLAGSDDARARLRGLLQTAEFFAREVRSLEDGGRERAKEEARA
jgi:CRISPR-associated protein Cmr2